MSDRPRKNVTRGRRDAALGVALFAFIPLVLFLFVSRPEPLAISFIAGVVLMLSHRLIAKPYMRQVGPRICLWSHRGLATNEVDSQGDIDALEIHHGGGVQPARCLTRHRHHINRFFTFARRFRPVLALGIFAPLQLLLTCLGAAAFGFNPPFELPLATAIFQGIVGLTVNFAAWGYLGIRDIDERLSVGFPAHNFFLLGIGKLLWVFRLMGAWWIVRSVLFFVDRLSTQI